MMFRYTIIFYRYVHKKSTNSPLKSADTLNVMSVSTRNYNRGLNRSGVRGSVAVECLNSSGNSSVPLFNFVLRM
jgi:hypothetical protein